MIDIEKLIDSLEALDMVSPAIVRHKVTYEVMQLVRQEIKKTPAKQKEYTAMARTIFESVKTSSKPKKKQTSRKKFIPPTYKEFEEYALTKSNKLDMVLLKRKFEAWEENGWKTGKDRQIRNWKTTLLNTLQYLESNGKEKQAYDRSRAIQDAETLFGKPSRGH